MSFHLIELVREYIDNVELCDNHAETKRKMNDLVIKFNFGSLRMFVKSSYASFSGRYELLTA